MADEPTGAINSPPSPEILQALGHWLIRWSGVDSTLDHCAGLMFNITLLEAQCITRTMTMRDKLNMLESRLNLDFPKGMEIAKDEALPHIAALRRLNDKRNDLVHSGLVAIDTGTLHILKTAARQKLVGKMTKMDPGEVHRMIDAINYHAGELWSCVIGYSSYYADRGKLYRLPGQQGS